MLSHNFKNLFIFLMLGLLTASAFFIRLHNFEKDNLRSIDEVVFFRMARQVHDEGPGGYHTIPYGKELADSGRSLPPYFSKPLYKHPPVFTFLGVLSMRLFGVKMVSMAYISILFGVLIIPLTFLIGRELFDEKIATAAAVFMWFDPVTVMTSQKVWQDTTMNFFMLFALYLFLRGMKTDRAPYFILGGIACGLGMLTKYTGVLAWITVLSVTRSYRRELFANKTFLFSLSLPFLMLVPWFAWNIQVYGWDIFLALKSSHRNPWLREHTPILLAMLVLAVAVGRIIRLLRERFKKDDEGAAGDDAAEGWLSRKKVNIALGCFLMGALYQSILNSLQPGYLPRTSWASSVFFSEPATFYAAQLIEYSLIYLFAFAALFLERGDALFERAFLRHACVIALLFFTIWRSFQCRYVLFVLPLLAVLGIELIFTMFRKISRINNTPLRMLLTNLLALLVLYAAMRTYYIDVYLSFTNDMCYY